MSVILICVLKTSQRILIHYFLVDCRKQFYNLVYLRISS